MRKHCFILLFLLSGTAAQINAQMGLGIRMGIQYASLNVEDYDVGLGRFYDQTNIPGFEFGLIMVVPMRRKFAFQLEAETVRKKKKYEFSDGVNFDRLELTIRNLHLLSAFRMNFGKDIFKGYGLTGFYFGQGFRGELIREKNQSGVYSLEQADLISVEVGVVIGGGVAIHTESGDLMIDLKSKWSIGAFQDIEGLQEPELYTTNGFTVSVGYIFLLGK